MWSILSIGAVKMLVLVFGIFTVYKITVHSFTNHCVLEQWIFFKKIPFDPRTFSLHN
jgi:hypothetical protein